MNELSKIVRTIASIVFPFILIYGLYVIVHGHLTPGGGFQGGAVAASGSVLLLVAYGSVWTVKKVQEEKLSVLESLGALGFISLAFLGIISATFFFNFLAGSGFIFGSIPPFGSNSGNINTAGLLPLMNLAVGLKVMVGLFAIVLTMAFASNYTLDKVRGKK